MATKKDDYQSLSAELDGVLARLQDLDIQVDDAVRLYEVGLKLVAALEKKLKISENKLTKLKLDRPGGA